VTGYPRNGAPEERGVCVCFECLLLERLVSKRRQLSQRLVSKRRQPSLRDSCPSLSADCRPLRVLQNLKTAPCHGLVEAVTSINRRIIVRDINLRSYLCGKIIRKTPFSPRNEHGGKKSAQKRHSRQTVARSRRFVGTDGAKCFPQPFAPALPQVGQRRLRDVFTVQEHFRTVSPGPPHQL